MTFICQVLENSLHTFFPQKKAPYWEGRARRSEKEPSGSQQEQAFFFLGELLWFVLLTRQPSARERPLMHAGFPFQTEAPKRESKACILISSWPCSLPCIHPYPHFDPFCVPPIPQPGSRKTLHLQISDTAFQKFFFRKIHKMLGCLLYLSCS